MRGFMGLHVMGKGGVDRPPIACNVEKNKKKKKQGKKQPGGDFFSFITV